ncbi:hypothetical protein [Brasilonema sp. UFV-L1]|uniref:hypothetical protein n=1 Tax=Brasilonema sp. UFV-L1 TaxID=2234130 RepID=UPI0030D77E6B
MPNLVEPKSLLPQEWAFLSVCGQRQSLWICSKIMPISIGNTPQEATRLSSFSNSNKLLIF